MTLELSIYKISAGDLVRFKDERLAMLAPADRKRLEGRVGVAQGYWQFTRKLTVAFAEDDARPPLRILSVDPRQLERVANAVAPDAGNGDAKLSQGDTDNLFG